VPAWRDDGREYCYDGEVDTLMITLPSDMRIWIACGVADLHNGFDGLAALMQTQLSEDPML
jgi:hypothetical protein